MCKPVSETAPVGDGKLSASLRGLIPEHPAAAEALAIAEAKLPAAILNHSFRTFLYTNAFLKAQENESASLSPVQPLTGSPHSLFVACMFHDVGVASEYDAGDERFEITGADMAAQLLRKHGASEDIVWGAWLAAVLHNTPGIPNRIGGSVRAMRSAIQAEFSPLPLPGAEHLPEQFSTKEAVEKDLPRLGIEKVLGDAVVRQARVNPVKAPASCWPGDLVRAAKENPEWEGVNKGF